MIFSGLFIIDRMACLDIVIAYGGGIVTQIVQDLGGYIGLKGIDIFELIVGRLSLKDITPV